MGQDGINNRVIKIYGQEIHGYESLFEGTSFDAGYLDTIQRQRGIAITGGGLKMTKLYLKWEGMEEVNKLNMVIGVPHLG